MDNKIIRLIKIKSKQFSEWMNNQAKNSWLKFLTIFIGIVVTTVVVYLVWNNFFNHEARAKRENEENKSFVAKVTEGIQSAFINMFNPSDDNLIAVFQDSGNRSDNAKQEFRPFVSVDKTSVYPGETLIRSGSGFTSKGNVSLLFSSPSGKSASASIRADQNGQFNHAHIISASAEIGVHYYWAKDITTNFITDRVKFSVAPISEKKTFPKETEEAGNQEKEESEEKDEKLSLPKKCSFSGSGLVNTTKRIVLNEIAWMGSTKNHSDEWIELKNASSSAINIAGWWLIDQAEQIKVIFPKDAYIPAGRFYLLERSDDETVAGVKADMIYSGTLSNSKEGLRLLNPNCEIEDEALTSSDWPAGDATSRKTMERKANLLGWQTSAFINGTPKQENSVGESVKKETQTPTFSGGSGGGESGGERASAPAPPKPTFCSQENLSKPTHSPIIFNEIAWMGTVNSANDEWIELKNISGKEINLAGWQLLDKDNQIRIIFTSEHRMTNNEFLFLERTDDNSAPGITADLIYAGGLSNSDEALYLFNKNCELQDKAKANPDWLAGDNASKRTMERKADLNWQTSANSGGTPKNTNSAEIITQTETIIQTGLSAQARTATPTSSLDPPQIVLSYPPQNPVNKEIIVTLPVSNFKNAIYDIKISIETEKVLSEIYNKKENKWQSSFYYLNNHFFENSSPKSFKLKIKDRDKNFRGEANIFAKIRESGKKESFLVFKDIINITDPEQTTSISNQSQNQSQSPEQEASKLKPAQNLLLNEFFKEWINNNQQPKHWKGSHSFNTNWFQNTDVFIRKYSARVGSSAERTLFQDNLIVEKATYEAIVYLKGGGQARVAILMGETGHVAYGPWTPVDKNKWTGVIHTRSISAGNLSGIRIQTKNEENILIGAAWFSADKPPENWPFQN